jgi:hypothetical protein
MDARSNTTRRTSSQIPLPDSTIGVPDFFLDVLFLELLLLVDVPDDLVFPVVFFLVEALLFLLPDCRVVLIYQFLTFYLNSVIHSLVYH